VAWGVRMGRHHAFLPRVWKKIIGSRITDDFNPLSGHFSGVYGLSDGARDQQEA